MAKNQYEDLTERQRKFAEYYFELNNGTQAAIKAGYGEAGAHTEANRQLKNVKIKEYIDDLHKERRERIQNRMAGYAEEAIKAVFDLAMNAESEPVRASMLKDILDRSGYKPTDRIEQKTEGDMKITFGFVDPNAPEE